MLVLRAPSRSGPGSLQPASPAEMGDSFEFPDVSRPMQMRVSTSDPGWFRQGRFMDSLSPRRFLGLCEWQVLVLSLFAGALFILRLDALPLIGEETRRALIAREMEQSGDWIVPHQQGVPRLTKPPIQYWAIAVSTAWFGGESIFAIRFPSAVAVWLTAPRHLRLLQKLSESQRRPGGRAELSHDGRDPALGPLCADRAAVHLVPVGLAARLARRLPPRLARDSRGARATLWRHSPP